MGREHKMKNLAPCRHAQQGVLSLERWSRITPLVPYPLHRYYPLPLR